MNFISKYWFIIRSNLISVLFFFFSINLIATISFLSVYHNHVAYVDEQLKNNIIEYEEIDREQLCKISDCIRVDVPSLKKSYEPDKNGRLHKLPYSNVEFYKLHESLNFTSDWNFSVYNEESGSNFVLDSSVLIADYVGALMIFMPIIMLLYMGSLLTSISEEKDRALLAIAGNEALLSNKSMISITENIHHELNTPLEVIDNKIEKINRIVAEFLIEEHNITKNIRNIPKDRIIRNKKLSKLKDDFDFIRTASEQIYTVLNKMKNFKQMRYSNGNKSLRDIIEGGFKIINISNTNFDYKIDESLDNYKIDSDSIRNADLLSIILNHIKNSLEANANKIFIVFKQEDNGKAVFRIVDNGNGIPLKTQKNIFKPNFSTKSNETGIRGNGMYLNKHMLTTAGGNLSLVSSSYKGTTIELSIPAKLK